MTLIQLLSDLHLEVEREADQPLYTYDFPKSPDCDILALLGDIGWTRDDRLFDWLETQLSRFKRVFFVLGNHEPYVSTLEESEARLEAFAQKSSSNHQSDPSKGEFIFLNRKRYDLSPDITILGCTLWSRLNPDDLDILSWSLTDFKRIEGFTPEKYQAAHEQDREWLRNTIESIRKEEGHRRIVVFTHHAPTIEGTGDPKFLGGPTNSAFATELTKEEWWGPPISLWAFGHTHFSCDFERGGVRVVSNQRGYKEGAKDFEQVKVLSI
ncbi:Ser/Thr protein phosphatase superfamily protein [Coprinopsis cinerea okayama7|uniref:Ser/Thr protein phosphatase superfamily protein n=1 Tax=Coprinopsis cinerea (strain Okayama-7 / 130 / ATCC MYA-4618 / FGSC 9003) TaxID=240176 RepID=A8N3Q9_COPC7|nr:Ser/Thr protein phosphatase superfamily protein [Coprinopsis cinerea okayama7\|eukprot:XP_001829525.1 Ser/Thr protein phosphatase superfamily protein [Coprinopsis cinerea okayama7\